MTYVRVLHTDVADERWLAAGSDAFALHIAAMVWCDRRLTNGLIPKAIAWRGALSTVAPDDTASAVEALLLAGFWVEEGDAFRLVDYLEHAFPAEQVQRTRARWKSDKDRRRQHDNGDHSLCKDPKYCPVRKAELEVDSTRGSTVESTGGGSHLDQTQPNQTRPDRRSGSGSGSGGSRGRFRWGYITSAPGTEVLPWSRQRRQPRPVPRRGVPERLRRPEGLQRRRLRHGAGQR